MGEALSRLFSLMIVGWLESPIKIVIIESNKLYRLRGAMPSRSQCRSLPRETLQILEQGSYTNQKGERIEIKEALREALQNTKLYF